MSADVVLTASLREALDEILRIAREVEVTNGTEEDLKVEVEKALHEHVWSKLKAP